MVALKVMLIPQKRSCPDIVIMSQYDKLKGTRFTLKIHSYTYCESTTQYTYINTLFLTTCKLLYSNMCLIQYDQAMQQMSQNAGILLDIVNLVISKLTHSKQSSNNKYRNIFTFAFLRKYYQDFFHLKKIYLIHELRECFSLQ